MLHATNPNCLPIAYADWELPRDGLSTTCGATIPWPPPGDAECDSSDLVEVATTIGPAWDLSLAVPDGARPVLTLDDLVVYLNLVDDPDIDSKVRAFVATDPRVSDMPSSLADDLLEYMDLATPGT